METKEYRTIDKSLWERGRWDDEPDKVQWKDQATGMPCLAVRQPESGHWCGYVGVAPGHPAHGLHYRYINVDCHGGLTFADFCGKGPEAEAICHIPEPGEPEKLWWFGFDCHHWNDRAPGLDALMKRLGSTLEHPNIPIYRTLEYVKDECAALAKQLRNPDLIIHEADPND